MPAVTQRDPESGEELHVPTNPAEIQTSVATETRQIALDNFGTLARPSGRSPTTYRFSGTFFGPDRANQFPLVLWKPPEDCRYLLEWWHDRQARRPPLQPLEFSVTQDDVYFSPILKDVYIASLGFAWRGGWRDLAYDIELTEWRAALIGIDDGSESGDVWTASEAVRGGDGEPEPPLPADYIVQPGDSLWNIAQAFLGDGARWEEIWNIEANRETIGANPDGVEPGQTLLLPGGTNEPVLDPPADASYEEIAHGEGEPPTPGLYYSVPPGRRRRSW